MQKKCCKHSRTFCFHSLRLVFKFYLSHPLGSPKMRFLSLMRKVQKCEYLLVFLKSAVGRGGGGVVQFTGACIRSQVTGLLKLWWKRGSTQRWWMEGGDGAACVRVSVSAGDVAAAEQRPLCCCCRTWSFAQKAEELKRLRSVWERASAICVAAIMQLVGVWFVGFILCSREKMSLGCKMVALFYPAVCC